MKLTERPNDYSIGQVYCSVEIKYLMVFEKTFSTDVAEGQQTSELQKLQTALLSSQNDKWGLNHRFFDEDNALIPYFPDGYNYSSHHIVGGPIAVTGVEGDAFRVLLAFEKSLDPKYPHAKVKDAFMGENYPGEHPLNKARKFVVSGTLPKDQPPAATVARNEDVLRTTAGLNERKEIAVPEGWLYWSHTSNGGREDVIRDGQGRPIGVAIQAIGSGMAQLAVTVRRKQDA
jgi:hypothetical protein